MLCDTIRKIVYHWDPIDLVSFPKDEYDSESDLICESVKQMIENGNLQEEMLAKDIDQIFSFSFGNDIFKCTFDECLSIAIKIKSQI